MLSGMHLSGERDQLVWKFSKNEIFSVKNLYERLMGDSESTGIYVPVQQIWKNSAPSKIAFFAWEAYRGRILTIDKLMRRGKIMVNGCYMCWREAETCNHLLLWCPVAYDL